MLTGSCEEYSFTTSQTMSSLVLQFECFMGQFFFCFQSEIQEEKKNSTKQK